MGSRRGSSRTSGMDSLPASRHTRTLTTTYPIVTLMRKNVQGSMNPQTSILFQITPVGWYRVGNIFNPRALRRGQLTGAMPKTLEPVAWIAASERPTFNRGGWQSSRTWRLQRGLCSVLRAPLNHSSLGSRLCCTTCTRGKSTLPRSVRKGGSKGGKWVVS